MTRSILPPGPPDRFFGLPLLRQMRHDYLGLAQQMHARYGDAVMPAIVLATFGVVVTAVPPVGVSSLATVVLGTRPDDP